MWWKWINLVARWDRWWTTGDPSPADLLFLTACAFLWWFVAEFGL